MTQKSGITLLNVQARLAPARCCMYRIKLCLLPVRYERITSKDILLHKETLQGTVLLYSWKISTKVMYGRI